MSTKFISTYSVLPVWCGENVWMSVTNWKKIKKKICGHLHLWSVYVSWTSVIIFSCVWFYSKLCAGVICRAPLRFFRSILFMQSEIFFIILLICILCAPSVHLVCSSKQTVCFVLFPHYSRRLKLRQCPSISPFVQHIMFIWEHSVWGDQIYFPICIEWNRTFINVYFYYLGYFKSKLKENKINE